VEWREVASVGDKVERPPPESRRAATVHPEQCSLRGLRRRKDGRCAEGRTKEERAEGWSRRLEKVARKPQREGRQAHGRHE
jgi:hypothetical protein